MYKDAQPAGTAYGVVYPRATHALYRVGPSNACGTQFGSVYKRETSSRVQEQSPQSKDLDGAYPPANL
jgi:hypothetical protein